MLYRRHVNPNSLQVAFMHAIRSSTRFIVKHRFAIWDGFVFFAVAAILIILVGEYDLLRAIGLREEKAEGIVLSEVIFMAIVLGGFLYVSLRRMQAQQREVKRRVSAERRARELAFQDPLTGLPNRRQFDETVTMALAAPPGADRVHAVLLLDLNGFKSINDVFGHPVGDEVLKEVSSPACFRRPRYWGSCRAAWRRRIRYRRLPFA